MKAEDVTEGSAGTAGGAAVMETPVSALSLAAAGRHHAYQAQAAKHQGIGLLPGTSARICVVKLELSGEPATAACTVSR